MKRLFGILLLMLASLSVSATTYYISPAGNDATGVGTEALPWRTIFKGSTAATEWGDTIHVKEGTYTESQRTVLEPGVSIEGENMATTIITYSYATSGFSDGCIYIVSSSVTNGNQSISNITIKTNNYTSARGIYTRYRNNVIIHDVTVSGFDKSGINAYSEIDWVTPPTTFTTGLRIYNCIITDCSEAPCTGNECNLRWSGHSDYEIYNNTFTNTTRPAQDNIYSSQVKNGSLHNNVFYTLTASASMYIFAAELFNNRGGVDVYENIIYGLGTIDIAGHTIVKGIYDYGIKIRNNTMIAPSLVNYNDYPTVGITIECYEYIESAYVSGNKITNFPWGISVTVGGSGGATIKDIYIYSNIIENSASANVSWTSFGIGIIQQSGSLTRRNINIINNTVTGNQTYSYRGIYISVDGTNDDFDIKNNIVQDFDYGIRFDNKGGTIDSLHLVNNLIHDCGTALSIESGTGINYGTYINTGQLTSDPLFISTTDFHLQETSPAIGSGVYLGSPYLYDYDGVLFEHPPVRGAFEYPTEEPPPATPGYGRRGGKYVMKFGKIIRR